MITPIHPACRTEALRRLSEFVPDAGRSYAARRNFDLGSGNHSGVSTLSSFVRHRVLSEEDVLRAVLGRHSRDSASKFVQEVFWRTYWKGWLERRPAVWAAYRAGLMRAHNDVQTQSGLRARWESACLGQTGIDCFDHWAQELAQTWYLHNHARMWFASIWTFTLDLPWELGADFFLRHLSDGDPASNTLSWRWVAGLQTPGKTYLARPDNIARYTEGRFHPKGLATRADALSGPPHPMPGPVPVGDCFDHTRPTALLLHEDDLSPGWLFELGVKPLGSATLDATAGISPWQMAPGVTAFKHALIEDCCLRWGERLGPVSHGLTDARDVTDWARSLGAEQIVTPYAPVGPVAAILSEITDIPVLRPIRAYDTAGWGHATAGFFKFRDKIPALLDQMRI